MSKIRQDGAGRRLGARPWTWSVVLAGFVALAAVPPLRDRAAGLFREAAPLVTGRGETADRPAEAAPPARTFRPTPAQRAALAIASVDRIAFVPESSAEGRIALNDDENVPVYSPYAGRVGRVLARAGEDVKANQLLFTVEASDMVQAQSDDQAAINALAKAREQLKLNRTIADRQRMLFQAKAAALKDYESAQNDVVSAESDATTAAAALEAVRNRLRILGKSDAEIAAFEAGGRMNAETEIRAPIAGTVVQRKLGLGQYLSASGDPQFVIGNLATVWLIADVREGDIARIRLGQPVVTTVNGFGARTFRAHVTYMAASLDPPTRRLAVRCEIENPDGELRAEMFGRFAIITGPAVSGPAVPDSAVVQEGDGAHVWVLLPDGAIEAREIKLGLRSGDRLQVTEGLKPGDQIVVRGALFIDRAANGEKAS
ncbi:efflux RND transporter periplasmic adaptor subunit [Methylobacterium sp. J-030]|uniref:efflux RND transporter periplasmic adaptor subunit n=1 Tax=Methylobacterium sp. J-030 TaxID=2836627 RepID=UPI001FBA0505|nr:efflux RND transporter periplasmic adaptor subunit [Methylobacterium sp. J-030]MCJ2067347.1 efflux RND transporter periplasmic adaptor subunit [Methylobacterium sp. J-030]